MSSRIVIQFNSEPAVDTYIHLKPGYVNNLRETFKTVRSGNYQCKKDPSTSLQALNYFQAFSLDYNSSRIFTISVNANEVEIIHPENGFFLFIDFANTTSGAVVISPVDDEADIPGALVELDEYTSFPSDPCSSLVANLIAQGGDASYKVYSLPDLTLLLDEVPSPFSFLVNRGAISKFRVTDSTGFFIGEITLNPPFKILQENISFEVNNQSGGSTLTVNVINAFLLLPLEYSLDDNSYQESNVFPSLTPDTYTVYVKDAFGCVVSKNIVLDGVTESTETIFSMSEINALRYSKVQQGAKKNHKNTLSCNELKKIRYPYIHKYLEDSIIPTQFKTNAQYINVFAFELGGTQHPISTFIKTDNIGKEARTTCTYHNIQGGRSAVYFGIVDILDVVTEDFISTTDFGFTLPEWANRVGQLVTISGAVGELRIDRIGYSDTYDAFIIEFGTAYTGAPIELNLYSKYNLQEYDVYEFDVVMAALPSSFNILVEVGTDVDNIDFTYISERVKLVEDSDSLFKIKYYDIVNKGSMVYQTGIQFHLFLEGWSDNVGDQKTEGYDGDTDFFVTDNVVYDSRKWTFKGLSGEMITKLRLIVTHKILEINGILWKLSEVPEIKTNEFNNYKTFSVLLKTGGDLALTDGNEALLDGSEAIAGAIEASRGKALILWTKTNG